MHPYVLIIAVISVFLCGCPEIGVITKDKSFTVRDSIELETPRKDIINIITEVGKSLNYEVSYIDNKMGVVCLQNESGSLALGAIGYTSLVNLTISVEDEGKKINIATTVAGNLGAGTENRALTLMNNIKTKFLDYIKAHSE